MQDHLWQQLFPDPTRCWDNRRDGCLLPAPALQIILNLGGLQNRECPPGVAVSRAWHFHIRRGCCEVARVGINDGRYQEQEHLWQQFFLDCSMWWDNRRDKKGSVLLTSGVRRSRGCCGALKLVHE